MGKGQMSPAERATTARTSPKAISFLQFAVIDIPGKRRERRSLRDFRFYYLQNV